MRALLEWRPLPTVVYMVGSVLFLLGSALALWRELRK